MHYWKVIDKKTEQEVKDVRHFIVGAPGRARWVYILENVQTKEIIAASATAELAIGATIHAQDIQPIG